MGEIFYSNENIRSRLQDLVGFKMQATFTAVNHPRVFINTDIQGLQGNQAGLICTSVSAFFSGVVHDYFLEDRKSDS